MDITDYFVPTLDAYSEELVPSELLNAIPEEIVHEMDIQKEIINKSSEDYEKDAKKMYFNRTNRTTVSAEFADFIKTFTW